MTASPQPAAYTLHLSAGRWRVSLDARLPDRPGSLALLAGLAASVEANIERLVYDRAEDPNTVGLTVSCQAAAQAGSLLDLAASQGLLPGEAPAEDDAADEPLAITDMAGVLSFKVSLANRPGSLAALAALFAELSANVIHMRYDVSENPEMAEVSAATSGAAQVSRMLGELTGRGYHYHVLWRGGEDADVDAALGLSGVEAFLFKLRHVLPPERMNTLEELFSTSRAVRSALSEFRHASGASGEALAASEVFANILRLAALALGSTGDRFTMRLSGPARLTPQVSLYMLSCPEGANSYLLRRPDGMTMLDTNFGIYFDDVVAWLSAHGFDPSRIDTVLATHPDADHAGWAGRLQERYGAKVYMHPDAALVFEQEDRTLGRGPLAGINRPFTRLVGRLSGMTAPVAMEPFEPASGAYGGFPVVGKVAVADLELLALESLGGHAAAQVFYFSPATGALFSGDYLLDAGSLSPRERDALSVHKTLLTSTNTDSALFSREMNMLKGLMRQTERDVAKRGGRAMVFPGHGDFYAVDQAGW